MIITSRFSKCGTIMSVGTRVEWTKGSQAKHVGDCQRLPDRGVELRKHVDDVLDMLVAGTATICADAIRDNEVWVRLPNQTVARIERDDPYIAATQYRGE